MYNKCENNTWQIT